MRTWQVLFLSLLTSTLCFAQQPDRVTGAIAGQMVALTGQVNHRVKPQYDQGPVEASFKLSQVTLLTLPSPSQQKALSLLLAAQQNPKSASYHKWLTPEQYADRFGLSPNDIQKISAWLTSEGFTVASVARGRNWIVFGGTAGQIESAFRTELHYYKVDGKMHFANAWAPSIPAALSGIVQGFRGFDSFGPKPMYVKRAGSRTPGPGPNYYDASLPPYDFMAPNDIQTFYDLGPLYTAGFDGTGQSMVIVGETDVYLADLNAFRAGFGLPTINCTPVNGLITTSCNTSNFQYILNGTDPGVSLGDLTESDLDLEWSAATAPGAKIIFVNSSPSNTSLSPIGGVWNSFYYAIDNKLAPVISMSYGFCEFDDNYVAADEVELMKANSFGITFVNSSGDSGAASCDPPPDSTNNLAVQGLAVSYPASSPEVTGVGGTAISYPYNSSDWGTNNSTNNGGTVVSYIPEIAWNDDVELAAAYPSSGDDTALEVQESYAIVSSGGGASNCSVQSDSNSDCASGFPQPSWQTVTISGQTTRLVPDVSLLASPNFPGYVYCTPVEELSSTSPYDSETTSSCGTGTAANITTAVSGIPGSQPNTFDVDPSLVGGTSASAPMFAAMVTIINQYLNGTSTAGLSNINPTLYTLAENTTGVFHPVTSGTNNVYCEADTPAQPWPTALVCPSGTNPSFGYNASDDDPTTGYNIVTGLGSVDANALAVAWKAYVTPDFAISAGSLTPSPVPAGQSASSTITISAVAGSTGTVVNFMPSSCKGLPTGATCSFNPMSVPFNGTDQATTVVTIATAANMAIPSGPQTITITPTNSFSTTTTVNLTVTATTESFTLSSTASTYSVAVGGTAAVQIAVASTTGFIAGTAPTTTTALPLTYTCTGSPSLTTAEISCELPNGGQPTNATGVTVTLVTTAPTTQLRPLGRSSIFYALLLPGLFGVVFLARGRTRGLRLLSLIVVLGFSTVWLGSCSSGGSNTSTPPNPGSTVGSYTVTVSATTGGANPITSSLPAITLNVTAQ